MRRRLLLLLALLAGAVAALPAAAHAAVTLQSVGGSFEQPVAVTGAPGDDQRLYIVEQRGTIDVVRDGVAHSFVDLSAAVRGPGDAGAGDEEGLLGLAFAPDFQTSRLFYVYFTDTNGDNRVEELRAPTGDGADPTSRRLVLPIPHPSLSNHNGGTLRFGPDGLLWLAPGDGGTGGANARDLGSLLGKVLRIDPRGTAPGQYAIPPDNPFAGQAGRRGEIWAYGLRNPFRFTFDRATGDLVIGDVGQSTTEEIDFLPSANGRGRGADLGWNTCEGSFEQGSTTRPCPLTGSVLPAIDRFQSDGYRSIIAGFVVRDPTLPSLLGRLVYGDYFVSALRTAQLSAGGASDDRAVGAQADVPQLTSFGEDAAGCVYATSGSGAVYRLVEQDAQIPCALPPAIVTPPPLALTRAGGGSGSGRSTGASLRIRAQGRQHVLRLRGAVVHLRCQDPCHAAAGAQLRIGRRRFPLHRVVSATATVGASLRLKPRLGRRGVRALRAALAEGRQPLVVVRLRVRNADDNPSPLMRRTIRAIG